MAITSNSQDVNTHKWDHRIVIVISKTKESKAFKNQVRAFKKSLKDFIERKLIVYYVLPKHYKLVDYKKDDLDYDWIASSKLFETYAENGTDYKVILIGLDGSIKLQQDQLITASKLFETIDTMPMRKSELRNRDN